MSIMRRCKQYTIIIAVIKSIDCNQLQIIISSCHTSSFTSSGTWAGTWAGTWTWTVGRCALTSESYICLYMCVCVFLFIIMHIYTHIYLQVLESIKHFVIPLLFFHCQIINICFCQMPAHPASIRSHLLVLCSQKFNNLSNLYI